MILGFLLQDYLETGIKVPVTIKLAKQTSSILIAGKSGSGKSKCSQWYIHNMLENRESLVYLADYKAGEEYELLEGSNSYASGSDAVKMIEDFYEFFTEVRKNRIRLDTHYTLFIEEWLGLLTYSETISKKLKSELQAKVGEILAVSRGLNLGVILCVQRADASNFTLGSREQFQAILSFGRCSSEQFKMLGFSGDLKVDFNSTLNFKPGQSLALIDGQENVKQIIVPLIKNPNVMLKNIKYYLDQQPDINSLTRAVGPEK